MGDGRAARETPGRSPSKRASGTSHWRSTEAAGSLCSCSSHMKSVTEFLASTAELLSIPRTNALITWRKAGNTAAVVCAWRSKAIDSSDWSANTDRVPACWLAIAPMTAPVACACASERCTSTASSKTWIESAWVDAALCISS